MTAGPAGPSGDWLTLELELGIGFALEGSPCPEASTSGEVDGTATVAGFCGRAGAAVVAIPSFDVGT